MVLIEMEMLRGGMPNGVTVIYAFLTSLPILLRILIWWVSMFQYYPFTSVWAIMTYSSETL